jgi:hypothetical protein
VKDKEELAQAIIELIETNGDVRGAIVHLAVCSLNVRAVM